MVAALVSSSSTVAVSLIKRWGEIWAEALKELSWAEIVFVISTKAQHVAGKRARWQMGWVQLQSYQGDTVERLSGRQVGHSVDTSLWVLQLWSRMWWYELKALLGRGPVAKVVLIFVHMENFTLGDRSFKSVSSGWACMYSLKSNSGEEKLSWRLQQKCPVQVCWAVVALGGYCA